MDFGNCGLCGSCMSLADYASNHMQPDVVPSKPQVFTNLFDSDPRNPMCFNWPPNDTETPEQRAFSTAPRRRGKQEPNVSEKLADEEDVSEVADLESVPETALEFWLPTCPSNSPGSDDEENEELSLPDLIEDDDDLSPLSPDSAVESSSDEDCQPPSESELEARMTQLRRLNELDAIDTKPRKKVRFSLGVRFEEDAHCNAGFQDRPKKVRFSLAVRFNDPSSDFASPRDAQHKQTFRRTSPRYQPGRYAPEAPDAYLDTSFFLKPHFVYEGETLDALYRHKADIFGLATDERKIIKLGEHQKMERRRRRKSKEVSITQYNEWVTKRLKYEDFKLWEKERGYILAVPKDFLKKGLRKARGRSIQYVKGSKKVTVWIPRDRVMEVLCTGGPLEFWWDEV